MKKLQKKHFPPFFQKRPYLARPFGLFLIIIFPFAVVILSIIGLKEFFCNLIEILTWDGK